MSIRIVITVMAAPGRGDELAAHYKERCASVMAEPGCEQFEVFQSVLNPDRMAVHERWRDQSALDAHSELNKRQVLFPPGLRGDTEREDYVYNRTR